MYPRSTCVYFLVGKWRQKIGEEGGDTFRQLDRETQFSLVGQAMENLSVVVGNSTHGMQITKTLLFSKIVCLEPDPIHSFDLSFIRKPTCSLKERKSKSWHKLKIVAKKASADKFLSWADICHMNTASDSDRIGKIIEVNQKAAYHNQP